MTTAASDRRSEYLSILMALAVPCDQDMRWEFVGSLELLNAFATAAFKSSQRLLHVPCAAQVIV
jgi:hypothetical protein